MKGIAEIGERKNILSQAVTETTAGICDDSVTGFKTKFNSIAVSPNQFSGYTDRGCCPVTENNICRRVRQFIPETPVAAEFFLKKGFNTQDTPFKPVKRKGEVYATAQPVTSERRFLCGYMIQRISGNGVTTEDASPDLVKLDP